MKKIVLMSLVLLTMIATSVVFAQTENALAQVAYLTRMDEDRNVKAANAIRDAVIGIIERQGIEGDPAMAAYDARIAENKDKKYWISKTEAPYTDAEVKKLADAIWEAVQEEQQRLGARTKILADEVSRNTDHFEALKTVKTFLGMIPKTEDQKLLKRVEQFFIGVDLAVSLVDIVETSNRYNTASEIDQIKLNSQLSYKGLDYIGKVGNIAFGPIRSTLLDGVIKGAKSVIDAYEYYVTDIFISDYDSQLRLDPYVKTIGGEDYKYRDVVLSMMNVNASVADIHKTVNALKVLESNASNISAGNYTPPPSFHGKEIGGKWYSPKGDEIFIDTSEGEKNVIGVYRSYGDDPLVFSAVKEKIIEIEDKKERNVFGKAYNDLFRKDQVFKNILSDGKSKWTGEIRTIVTGVDKNNNEIAKSTTWSDCTIIMSKDKQSLTVSYQLGPRNNKVDITEIWTKENQRPSIHVLDGFFRVVKESGMEKEIEGPIVNVSGGSATLTSYGEMNSRQAYAAYYGLWQLGTAEWRKLIYNPEKKAWEGEVRQINKNIFGSSVGTKWVEATFNKVDDDQINVNAGGHFTIYKRYDLIKEGLNGVWEAPNGWQITINGNTAINSKWGSFTGLSLDAINKGVMTLGGYQLWNIRSTGNLTWSAQEFYIGYNTSTPNVANGQKTYRDCTITMSADGQTIAVNDRAAFTRR